MLQLLLLLVHLHTPLSAETCRLACIRSHVKHQRIEDRLELKLQAFFPCRIRKDDGDSQLALARDRCTVAQRREVSGTLRPRRAPQQ